MAPRRVQRFDFATPDFDATRRAKATASGLEGAVFLFDGTPDPWW